MKYYNDGLKVNDVATLFMLAEKTLNKRYQLLII